MAEVIEGKEATEPRGLNFVEEEVLADLKAGKNGGRLSTRFPPEPNGYLHIGHAKAICMDFGIAEKFGGTCNLRFDDTNPVKEDVEYVDSIREDIHWLGFDWGDREYYASDYFPKLFDLAVRLIKEGKAYVDDQTSEEIARQKGTPQAPGEESPYRNRTPEENLDLFMRMNAGEFDEGARVLRAKIDMASPNMHFRDPIMYRIIKTPHHRTGTTWKVYPMYDFAHGQSDYFEGVTHSICTLEFVVHRPLYEYFVKELADDSYCPRQIEFPSQPHLHRDEQAQTASARQRRPRGRLGRPPYADHFGYAPTRLHPCFNPQLHRHYRLHQIRGSQQRKPPRTRRARRPQPYRHTRHGRNQSSQGGAHQLPRG